MNIKLNYKINKTNVYKKKIAIILIHGLFGDLKNLEILAKYFSEEHDVIQIDLRNHGKSPHADSMSYQEMAYDVFVLLNNLSISECIIIGHSIGGKVAMTLSILIPFKIFKIIILDIAPVKYDTKTHHIVFNAIEHVNKLNITNRNKAFYIMMNYIQNKNIVYFLLKSFHQGKWIFNLPIIKKYYLELNDWHRYTASWKRPILFIKGELSSYLSGYYQISIIKQFPKAQIYSVNKANHWVHVENSDIVIKLIKNFLQ